MLKINNQAQCGFILFATLIMMSLLALTVLSLTQLVLTYQQTQNRLQAQHQDFALIEAAAHELALKHQPPCMIQKDDPNFVISTLIKNKPCTVIFAKQHYALAIENLGVFPCIYLQARPSVIMPTHHLRITLRALYRPSMILQLRVARPIPDSPNCDQTTTIMLHSRIVSWRYVAADLFL